VQKKQKIEKKDAKNALLFQKRTKIPLKRRGGISIYY